MLLTIPFAGPKEKNNMREKLRPAQRVVMSNFYVHSQWQSPRCCFSFGPEKEKNRDKRENGRLTIRSQVNFHCDCAQCSIIRIPSRSIAPTVEEQMRATNLTFSVRQTCALIGLNKILHRTQVQVAVQSIKDSESNTDFIYLTHATTA